MTTTKESNLKSAKVEKSTTVGPIAGMNQLHITIREHAEFHNCYSIKSVKEDIAFLQAVYNEKISLSQDDISQDFVNNLKLISKEVYFFFKTLETDLNPQNYIKAKFEFIRNRIPNGDPNLFYIAWNGLIKNDSFRRILLKTFSLGHFSDVLCPQSIPTPGSSMTRYRTKLILADDMAMNPEGSRRTQGRHLEDGSGLIMRENIVWLPNGKALPMFPQAYVPLNQTHVILIRHGKSIHESGGENPEFVGSGYWDSWDSNRRITVQWGISCTIMAQ